MGFSVKNAQTLRSWFENLPKGPQWKQDKIDTFGYPTTKPVHLYWRDGFEVAKWIFGNPVFANHMAYDPVRITLDEQGREREYTEYMTGEHAWKVQVCSAFDFIVQHTANQLIRINCLRVQLRWG